MGFINKCGSWRIAVIPPLTPAQGYRRGKEGVAGVVLIEVCLDDKFPNSE